MMKCVSLVGIVLFYPTAAMACSEPMAPDAPSSISKPSVPFCLRSYSFSGSHDCDQFEIDRYKNDVDDYIRKLKSYVTEAGQFYSDAADYAKCEMDEVLEQHK